MSFIYYSAAWTDCGCFITCFHLHRTVSQAVACICTAGGYVVAVQNGVMRSLTEAEETEFQCAVSTHSAASPTVEATQRPAAGVCDFSYATMIRIRVVNRWVWTTWMHFETYAEAVRFARNGMKVVRFRSPEWKALRQQNEPASPIVIGAARENILLRREDEAFFHFVFRLLSAYG